MRLPGAARSSSNGSRGTTRSRTSWPGAPRTWLGDDQLIAIGGGTTAVTLARALRRDLRATVLTSSLDVALALRTHPSITVDVLGGRLDRASQTLTGAGAVEELDACGRTCAS